MDEFVDYVSINSTRTGALCIARCAKFTLEAIDKCVCISYMYLGRVYRVSVINSRCNVMETYRPKVE